MKITTAIAAVVMLGYAQVVTPAHAGPAAVGGFASNTASDACKAGYVWREANGSDHVCVTPEVRQRTAEENRLADTRRNPGGSNPMECKSGFVWREAYAGDAVCVTPARRTDVREENRIAPTRVVYSPVLNSVGVGRMAVTPARSAATHDIQGQVNRPIDHLNPQPLPPQPPDRIVRIVPTQPLNHPAGPTPQSLPQVWRSLPAAWRPYGRIGDKYAALGGDGGPLGAPTSAEMDAPYGGRMQKFKNGTIYWHPQIGEAFSVRGAIASKFVEYGKVELGYPITDEMTTPDGRGRYNHFRAVHPSPGSRDTSIYWTPETGAHEIEGLIRDAWANNGWERSQLGYPTSDEFQDGSFRRSNFERGYILWSQKTGIQIKLAGAAITASAPKNTFSTLLVNGMELALKDRVIAGNPQFLSENAVCGQWNAHLQELNQWIQTEAVARVNARIKTELKRDDFGIRTSGTHVNFSNACSFRAEVLQACQDHVDVRLLLPGNWFQVYVMTPFTAKDGLFGDSDPKFIARADFAVGTRIRIPATPGGTLGIDPVSIGITNVKLESHNVTGDLIKSAVEIGSKFFTGQDFVAMLSQDRMFRLDGVTTSFDKLAPALRKIPSNYHVDACLRDGNVFRLNGTDVADTGPVVR